MHTVVTVLSLLIIAYVGVIMLLEFALLALYVLLRWLCQRAQRPMPEWHKSQLFSRDGLQLLQMLVLSTSYVYERLYPEASTMFTAALSTVYFLALLDVQWPRIQRFRKWLITC